MGNTTFNNETERENREVFSKENKIWGGGKYCLLRNIRA